MKDKVTKKENIITLVCIICLVVSAIGFMYVHFSHKNQEFVYTEHLDEVVLTVEEDQQYSVDVDMQEMAYYIINVEGDMQEMALQYDADNPQKYWRLRIEATYDMMDYAKDLAYDSCVRDNIYYIEAMKNGMELTKEEEELAFNDASLIMKALSGKQMAFSDYTVDKLYKLEKKLYLASKYVNNLVMEGCTKEELELEGAYYEALRKEYEMTVNEELWNEVVLGSLTVEN